MLNLSDNPEQTLKMINAMMSHKNSKKCKNVFLGIKPGRQPRKKVKVTVMEEVPEALREFVAELREMSRESDTAEWVCDFMATATPVHPGAAAKKDPWGPLGLSEID